MIQNETTKSLFFSVSDGKGNDYCTVILSSTENDDSLVVPAGTVFEVTSIIQNKCGNDWGRVCRLDLDAHNQDKNVTMSLICKDKGIFSKELTPSKVNKILKNTISVN